MTGGELPGPVEEWLAARAPLRPEVARRAARAYRDRDEPRAAVEVLLRAELSDEVADILSDLAPAEADAFELAEIDAIVGSLGSDVVERHLGALLHLACACEPKALVKKRHDLLEGADAIVERQNDHRLHREIASERARDLIRDGEANEAEALAADILAVGGRGRARRPCQGVSSIGTRQRMASGSSFFGCRCGVPRTSGGIVSTPEGTKVDRSDLHVPRRNDPLRAGRMGCRDRRLRSSS